MSEAKISPTEARINQANGRLKAGNLGVAMQQIGGKLYLQATLPPKPDSSKTKPFQQRIALGLPANPAGVSLAEKEARKVGGLIASGEFSWQPYLVKGRRADTVGEWIARFEADVRETVKPVTWRSDYENPFKKLPGDQPLTIALLTSVLETIPDNSRLRKRCACTFARLARFAGLEADFSAIQGNYSASKVEPRNLPTDEAIAYWFTQIPDPGWRWVYGMIATFGLRSHEVFYLETSRLVAGGNCVEVLQGKTGRHEVWSFYPEWVDAFNLRDPALPKVTGKEHIDFTNRTSKFFGRLGAGFTALDLRHCWAIRTLLYGLPYEVAARQMGHSVAVHEQTYHRWINTDHHQRVFDSLVSRTDRPVAPGRSTAHSFY